jgi:hypothetical protein
VLLELAARLRADEGGGRYALPSPNGSSSAHFVALPVNESEDVL